MNNGFIKVDGDVVVCAWGMALYKCQNSEGVVSHVLAAHRDFELTIITKAVWLTPDMLERQPEGNWLTVAELVQAELEALSLDRHAETPTVDKLLK